MGFILQFTKKHNFILYKKLFRLNGLDIINNQISSIFLK